MLSTRLQLPNAFLCFFFGAICQVMTGEGVDDMNPPKLYETGRPNGYVGCKAPMFSFTRLRYFYASRLASVDAVLVQATCGGRPRRLWATPMVTKKKWPTSARTLFILSAPGGTVFCGYNTSTVPHLFSSFAAQNILSGRPATVQL